MTIAGFPNVYELPGELEGDVIKGIRRVRRFRGTESDLLGMIPFVHVAGVQWTLTPEDLPMYILTLHFSDPDDGTDPEDELNLATVWTLEGNDLEKSLFEHPITTAWLQYLESFMLPETYFQFVGEFRNFISGNISYDQLNYFTSVDPAIQPIVTLAVNGVQSFVVSQFVLKRSTKVPAGWSSKWPTSNVDKQYTTAELEAAELVPATLKFNMPAGAWLKKSPRITQNNDGSWQVENEWWHGDSISEVLYPKAT